MYRPTLYLAVLELHRMGMAPAISIYESGVLCLVEQVHSYPKFAAGRHGLRRAAARQFP